MQALAAMLGAAKLYEAGCSHIPNKDEQMVSYGACPVKREVLQQCLPGKTQGNGGACSLHPGDRRAIKGAAEELGKAYTEDS